MNRNIIPLIIIYIVLVATGCLKQHSESSPSGVPIECIVIYHVWIDSIEKPDSAILGSPLIFTFSGRFATRRNTYFPGRFFGLDTLREHNSLTVVARATTGGDESFTATINVLPDSVGWFFIRVLQPIFQPGEPQEISLDSIYVHNGS